MPHTSPEYPTQPPEIQEFILDMRADMIPRQSLGRIMVGGFFMGSGLTSVFLAGEATSHGWYAAGISAGVAAFTAGLGLVNREFIDTTEQS